MTQVRELRATTVRVPLRQPTAFSTRSVSHREYVLVELVGDDGSTGIGYAYAGTSGGVWLARCVDELVAPLLVGRDADAFAENWDALYRELLLLGRRGAVLRALSAVDVAAWDRAARAAGEPLWRFLGGTRAEIPAYASGGYYRDGDAVANVRTEVERYRARGFHDYKMKVGRLSLDEEVERVRAAREALAPDARLALDANNAWTDVDTALRAAEAFAPFEIWWLEEPFLPDDVAAHAELAQRSPIPIATGEIEATRWAFADILRQRAAAILQQDAGVCGGVGIWLEIARDAAAAGVDVAPHWHANLHAHLASAAENCVCIEYFALEEDVYNFEALVSSPLRVENGFAILGDAPGLGFDFDPGAVARYRC
ncbi:MAG: mandelate racemase/muconate lactonizing enzyme family protein [Gaiella sp.]|nr:mandelate racemase/muconate lactonizing enzyme family protein [Gaiella sp.]